MFLNLVLVQVQINVKSMPVGYCSQEEVWPILHVNSFERQQFQLRKHRFHYVYLGIATCLSP